MQQDINNTRKRLSQNKVKILLKKSQKYIFLGQKKKKNCLAVINYGQKGWKIAFFLFKPCFCGLRSEIFNLRKFCEYRV